MDDVTGNLFFVVVVFQFKMVHGFENVSEIIWDEAGEKPRKQLGQAVKKKKKMEKPRHKEMLRTLTGFGRRREK